MGRRTQTVLPTSPELMKPQIPTNVEEKFRRQSNKQAKYYNCSSKVLPSIKVGDSVSVRFRKQWKPGKVVAKSRYPGSFVVQIGLEQYRRNRRDIRISPRFETPSYIADDTDDQETQTKPLL
ncbi:hypothetical protein HOLleu_24753 [Holothuria leucospilota]|uniref:Uncharacterized protein n=1 Tax=Holothuria leucospilota TaxID=206669 RepID=A0A9Q1BRX4_HOLLE|nr:hypothetical protein HOLleu_24753 [Holothuria leucospilota]